MDSSVSGWTLVVGFREHSNTSSNSMKDRNVLSATVSISGTLLHGILALTCSSCRSQWPRGLRHEPSSLAQTLGSWVRIPLKARMSVCAFILCLCCPV
jgi:hypothetical protein